MPQPAFKDDPNDICIPAPGKGNIKFSGARKLAMCRLLGYFNGRADGGGGALRQNPARSAPTPSMKSE
jgi:hypothetical protein